MSWYLLFVMNVIRRLKLNTYLGLRLRGRRVVTTPVNVIGSQTLVLETLVITNRII